MALPTCNRYGAATPECYIAQTLIQYPIMLSHFAVYNGETDHIKLISPLNDDRLASTHQAPFLKSLWCDPVSYKYVYSFNKLLYGLVKVAPSPPNA